MKILNTEINIISHNQNEVASIQRPNLSTETLVGLQDVFRERVTTILERAYERRVEDFEMSGLDNRYPEFPIVGTAKIVAQEIWKILKKDQHVFRTIKISVASSEDLELFQKTCEGYLNHIQTGLGEEPYCTVDIIIELPDGIVLIERSNPPYGWALPGGFIDAGEETNTAAVREAKEETNLDLVGVREFGVYDKPGRDPRFLTRSTVFIASGHGQAQFGDDAKGLKIIPYAQLTQLKFAFDHNQIIRDYLDQKSEL